MLQKATKYWMLIGSFKIRLPETQIYHLQRYFITYKSGERIVCIQSFDETHHFKKKNKLLRVRILKTIDGFEEFIVTYKNLMHVSCPASSTNFFSYILIVICLKLCQCYHSEIENVLCYSRLSPMKILS